MKRKKLIKTTACLFLILIIIRFFPNVIVPSDNTTYLVDGNLIVDALQQAKSHELDLESKYQVTAIILHWQHLFRVRQLVQHYVNSKLFKEIIVWNNNPQINLAYGQVVINNNSSTPVFVMNSKENLKDQAKYRACITVQTLVCFYADDDWDVSHYMKSLIASFRSDPNVLHSATNAITYYNNMLWTFTDTRIDLHTGFSWIGSGSVFLREHAERHLKLLMMHVKDHQELFTFSDVFFSIWLNDIPSQMVVNLLQLPTDPNKTEQAFSNTDNFYDFQHTSAVLAIQYLEYSLRLNESTTRVTFPRQQSRRFPYCVRSPSPNDDFIFYSNIIPIDIEHIPFDITRDADRATYRNVPGGPNYTHFASHNTLQAVDGDRTTCWSPFRVVNKGDFFAIDFLHIQNNIAFSLIIGHSQYLQRSLDVRVSFDGVWWISHRSFQSIFINVNGSSTTNFYKLVFESKQFPFELQSFRYIAFNATYAFSEAFQVCDIQIIYNLKINAT